MKNQYGNKQPLSDKALERVMRSVLGCVRERSVENSANKDQDKVDTAQPDTEIAKKSPIFIN